MYSNPNWLYRILIMLRTGDAPTCVLTFRPSLPCNLFQSSQSHLFVRHLRWIWQQRQGPSAGGRLRWHMNKRQTKLLWCKHGPCMHGEVHVGMHKGKMHIFVQDQFTGGEIHKLKIQILEGKMSKIGLQKLTVLLYPPLLPTRVGPFKLARP